MIRLGQIAAWTLYGLGHLASLAMPVVPYRLYNWLMLCSVRVQDRCGASGPWARVSDEA